MWEAKVSLASRSYGFPLGHWFSSVDAHSCAVAAGAVLLSLCLSHKEAAMLHRRSEWVADSEAPGNSDWDVTQRTFRNMPLAIR